MRRRTLLLGGGALVLAAAGGTAWTLKLVGRHYPATPYDDVLSRLADRDWAQRFGAQILAETPGYAPLATAARLRTLLGQDDLDTAALRDVAAERLVEAAKWLVPESIALYAMLAARPG